MLEGLDLFVCSLLELLQCRGSWDCIFGNKVDVLFCDGALVRKARYLM